MQAEFSVELGRDDDCLEVPWASADGSVRYFNLKAQPELLLEISEAMHNRELGEFLSHVNGPRSGVESAKCDTWLSDELNEEDAVFEAKWKFGSYVDLVFSAELSRLSFEQHERLAKELAMLLRKAPEIAASAEVVVRRCYFHRSGSADDSEPGFCITLYVFGYGDDEHEAKRRWVVAMQLAQNALMQATGGSR